MKRAIVERFGSPEVLEIVEEPDPEPGKGEVRVRLTSIGLNHADLMARRGEYRLYSGDPPFTPGLEGGGIIDATGEGVDPSRVGERVILSADAPRRRRPQRGQSSVTGTYRSIYIVPDKMALRAPDAIPDPVLGAIWLSFLTAWGCLVWKQQLQPGQVVGIPAASSSAGIAAGQVVKRAGAIPIGLTTSAHKAESLREMPESDFTHVVVTSATDGKPVAWHKTLLELTNNRGVDVFFDPVAAGHYLDLEIRSLARKGTIWIYGLLGKPGVADLTPLIRKHASIRGWLLGELVAEGGDALARGESDILDGFRDGVFRLRLAGTYPLDEVRRAHTDMEAGKHIGKLVLVP